MQAKKNELCELLREEIKQLQEVSQSKNEVIITLRRQIEVDQECILAKQSELKQTQIDLQLNHSQLD